MRSVCKDHEEVCVKDCEQVNDEMTENDATHVWNLNLMVMTEGEINVTVQDSSMEKMEK